MNKVKDILPPSSTAFELTSASYYDTELESVSIWAKEILECELDSESMFGFKVPRDLATVLLDSDSDNPDHEVLMSNMIKEILDCTVNTYDKDVELFSQFNEEASTNTEGVD